MTVRALILAGGSGTRLWPLSTDDRPKPFLPLSGKASLLRETYDRAARVTGEDNVLFSARASHAPHLEREFPGLAAGRLVLEPDRRNTAPAIALAALAVSEEDPDAVLVVLPSDQAVQDADEFHRALSLAVESARAGDAFLTLGIPPSRPETGFGYLEAGRETSPGVREVVRFVEKPPLAEAERHAVSGNHYWNAGIFAFAVRLLFSEMERLCPDVLEAMRAARAAQVAGDGAGFDAAFRACRSISIDYAVMEKARAVRTVPSACGWSDLGSWEAVLEFRGGADGRSVLSGPAIEAGGSGNLVLAGDRPVRLLGLSDVVVIDSPDGLLVMKRGSSDLLRASVEKSLAEGRT
ncbi:MAG: mannose-1-phosphate guanylyltransferase [Holophagales bacterium]|nr:mannose-1-phosphate guanylyltransferase [Holophagales bacterium]